MDVTSYGVSCQSLVKSHLPRLAQPGFLAVTSAVGTSASRPQNVCDSSAPSGAEATQPITERCVDGFIEAFDG